MLLKTILEFRLAFIILFFTIACLIFHIYTVKNPIKITDKDEILDSHIKFNLENKDLITSVITQVLQQRLQLLKDNKMSFKEWVDFNNQNNSIKIGNHIFFITVVERVFINSNLPDDYILRVIENKEYMDLSWKDTLDDISDKFISTKYVPDVNLLMNMFYTGSQKVVNQFDYYWISPLTNKIIRKKNFYLIHPEFTDIEGNKIKGAIIGIGYAVENISETYQILYYDYISPWAKITIALSVIFISWVILYTQETTVKGFVKSLIFVVFSLLFIILYSGVIENQNSQKSELEKINTIDNGVLSASFLVGVNIFIITAIKTRLMNHLNKETSLIFAVSIILLLFAIFRYTNYTTLREMITVRITSQYLFNYSVLLNAFILVNYIIFTIIFFTERIKY